MIQKSRSDLRGFEIPHNVQVLHAGLCDELGVPRWFWLQRQYNHKFKPRERFVLMCMTERMRNRFRRSYPEIAECFGLSHGSLMGPAILKRADTLFGLYPDLAIAVRGMDGYAAGRFIFETWRTPILMVCGEQPESAV